MPLDPAFIADAPYGPGGLLLDELLEVNTAESFVRVRMPSHEELPITREQRAHPVLHPRHVSGGLMVHMTGIAAFVHAYHVLGLRHAEGWIGYGVRIHSARFHALAPPGPPIEITCRATFSRKWGHRMLVRYSFRFTQAERLVYEGDQTALFLKLDPNAPAPEGGGLGG